MGQAKSQSASAFRQPEMTQPQVSLGTSLLQRIGALISPIPSKKKKKDFLKREGICLVARQELERDLTFQMKALEMFKLTSVDGKLTSVDGKSTGDPSNFDKAPSVITIRRIAGTKT